MLHSTSFFGRAFESTEIQRMLAQPDCRLLTIVGPGGIGKTRLAMHLSETLRSDFSRGSTVVYLQPLRSRDYVVPAMADALGFALTGQEEPIAQLGRYLSDKEMLLVLDNFEHLLDAADDLVTLLSMAPSVTYLVTSREALNLQEEWLYPIAGLRFPAETEPQSAEMRFDAVELFAARAARVRPDFALEQEFSAVVRICRLVSGLPLALELAAAWRRSLDCSAIADEIQSDLDFLSTRLRDMPERHRSMQAVFEQTWRRLTPREQATFARLSVFRGGFRREAAAAVAGAALAVLTALLDKSLLQVDGYGRYQIHELLRQYAAERLEENPEDGRQAQAGHAGYYIDYLYERRQDVFGGRQKEALLEIRVELDNIRAAWLWSVDAADADAFYRGGDALGLYYQFLGGYLEGMSLFTQAIDLLRSLPQDEANDLALLATLMYQCWYNLRFGRLEEAETCMAQSQVIYDRLGIAPLPGYLTHPSAPLGFVALVRGDYAAAIARAEEVHRSGEAEDHIINRQFAYHVLSEAYMRQGDYETASAFAQQAYAMSQRSGDLWFSAYILNNMGQVASALGDERTAASHFEKSYEIRHLFADPEGMALALGYLGDLALKAQAYDEAESRYQRSLEIYQEINDQGGLATANRGLGAVACKRGHYTEAHGYFSNALQIGVEINYRPLLLSLLVDIAEYLWLIGERARAYDLLTFTLHNPASDHSSKARAEYLVAQYGQQLDGDLLAAESEAGPVSTLETVTAALLHDLVLPPVAVYAEIVDPEAQGSVEPLIEPLTPRDRDVLTLLCAGLTNKEIADELVLAVGTVKFYTGQIYGKLGARNRVEAVARARELGLC